MDFNLNELKKEAEVGNRYEKRLSQLVAEGQAIDRIKAVVDTAIENIKAGQQSFVSYGEKTWSAFSARACRHHRKSSASYCHRKWLSAIASGSSSAKRTRRTCKS